nr:MAG TPA: hypothetical protein [Caudoviricetes sp.]
MRWQNNIFDRHIRTTGFKSNYISSGVLSFAAHKKTP